MLDLKLTVSIRFLYTPLFRGLAVGRRANHAKQKKFVRGGDRHRPPPSSGW
jgi:hypothetical protein